MMLSDALPPKSQRAKAVPFLVEEGLKVKEAREKMVSGTRTNQNQKKTTTTTTETNQGRQQHQHTQQDQQAEGPQTEELPLEMVQSTTKLP
uniref:AT5g22450/MWD9_25 n=1 Tax=Arabidopsis thaliana TaxID=3702 RepID=Q94BW1_ARATH|nr:AT5g22450/MWD9_25 [Arabidopsis thaliana]AAL87395.1 AT5g22450/MWD9_25 [Arabidopsis thaliana]